MAKEVLQWKRNPGGQRRQVCHIAAELKGGEKR
jgi:hypothetical protein